MTSKNPRPLTQPEPGDPNHGKSCYQPGSLHTTDLPMQPSLAERLGLKKTMDFAATLYAGSMDPPATMVIIHCPVCGWQQEVDGNMWKFQSSPVGHGYTCGSGKCPSHTAMVFGPAPFDHKACVLCDHVIVQQVLGNKCGQSGSLCCNLKECPIEARKRREVARPVLPDKTCDPSCPCRTPVCEETCPEYQFKGRFASWLAVNYPALDIKSHQDIVDNASGIFDEFWADRS
jgi:hypothetical protein